MEKINLFIHFFSADLKPNQDYGHYQSGTPRGKANEMEALRLFASVANTAHARSSEHV